MRPLAALTGCALLGMVLLDTFNTIVLPRRTQYGFRVSRVLYRSTYRPFAYFARRIRSGRFRESYLSVFGPFSLLLLIGIWAISIVIGFGLLQWAAGVEWHGQKSSLFDAIYLSSITFSTLGTAEPNNIYIKYLSMMEGLLGLGFLGLNIGYLPTLYQAFSHREVDISLLDARSGSPPSALGLLECEGGNAQRLENRLSQWENWAAHIMESHLSYPMLAYFRSHHVNQSWLTGLVAIVDASAIIMSCSEGDLKRQAGLTFAIGRHALADISAVFHADQPADPNERLDSQQFEQLLGRFSRLSTALAFGQLDERHLRRLRALYEPSAIGLSRHLLMALPTWVGAGAQENWILAGPGHRVSPYTVSDT